VFFSDSSFGDFYFQIPIRGGVEKRHGSAPLAGKVVRDVAKSGSGDNRCGEDAKPELVLVGVLSCGGLDVNVLIHDENPYCAVLGKSVRW
jgi:hypothetical protein